MLRIRQVRRWYLLALCLAVLPSLPACGGGDDDSGTAAETRRDVRPPFICAPKGFHCI